VFAGPDEPKWISPNIPIGGQPTQSLRLPAALLVIWRAAVVTAPAIFVGHEICGVNADRRQTCDELASLRGNRGAVFDAKLSVQVESVLVLARPKQWRLGRNALRNT
jgi:hypothetical protein